MNRRAPVFTTITLFVVSLFLTAVVRAQPVPVVNAPAALSIQRGQSTDLTLAGAGLGNVGSIALPDDSGLTATLVKIEKPTGAEVRLTLAASVDAAPGVREMRLVSPTGVSNPMQVWVEQYPLIQDRAPNTDPAKPQPISLPAIISGKMDAPGDADCYRFTALKGQQLVFNVLAARMRSQLDGNLLLYEAATGREIASNNDTFGPDPFLAFEVPADGQYVLEIRDLQYRGGGADYAYRIEAGAIPFVQSLSPLSSRRGSVVDVKATGFNLSGDAQTIRLDLRHVPPGRIPLRVKAAAGLSNEMPFEVTELAQLTEAEPNDDAKAATAVSPGSDISGVIAKPNDVDFFRFKLDRPTRFLADAYARRLGSPLDALLVLYDATGNAAATSDDAAGADPRLGRDLAPGDYVLAIRDLGSDGGPSFAYRVSLTTTLAAPDAPPQNFALAFQPDTPRVSRGSHTKMWCDVSRMNFPADVAITVEGLPPGVTVSSPATFPAVASGLLALSASGDAPLGTFPITLKATAPLNGELVTRTGQPEGQGGVVQQAYLTVLDAAPFGVQPLATVPMERVQQLAAEIPTLANKVLAPSPEVDARQAEWEKKVTATPTWVVLDAATLSSTEKATLTKDPDGSILAGGERDAQKDTYIVTAPTKLKGIVAVRLECLPHPSLGGNGPGRAGNGNFVLNRFAATIAPKANPPQATPVVFAKAQATFNQAQFEIAGAIDDNPVTGWGVSPQVGKPQTATFLTKEPIGDGNESVLTLTLDQNYGLKHTIGRFRLSISIDPAAADAVPVPEPILAVLKVPSEQRTPQQKATVGVYYRSIDPPLVPEVTRLALLQYLLAPRAEMVRLDTALNTQSPALDAEQAQWEQALVAGAGWTPLDAADLKSASGASFGKEGDGSIFVFGASSPTDTYTITASTPLKGVTGIRVEALPDPRLPGNGPGRSASGNFILSGVKVAVVPAAATTQPTTQPSSPVDVALASATDSFHQDKYPAADALDGKPETGWAVAPATGYPAAAEFFFKAPHVAEGGSVVTITLDHQASGNPGHALGRFRVSVTNAPDADACLRLPSNILAILKVPAAQRNDVQKGDIAAYHRRTAKSLQPVRQRLTEFRAAVPEFPPAVQRGRTAYLPVVIARGPNFAAGDVQVTLEGFSLGRDANGPVPIARSLKVTPVTINGNNVVGALTFTAEANAEQGTRLVVLRAEAKVGNDTIVQYSPAFPLTVN